MTLKVNPILRFIFIIFFIGLELLAVSMAINLIKANQLGIQEILMLTGTALIGLLGLFIPRMQLVIGDNYVEYFRGFPGSKRVMIRAADVEKIERSASPFQGRVDYIRMKGGKCIYTIFTDSMERRREVPTLLEKALHTKIIE